MRTRMRTEPPRAAGPITRCRSRAWKRYSIRPPAVFNAVACLPRVQSPASAHWLSANWAGRVDMTLVDRRAIGGGKALRALIADIILRRLQRCPIGGHFKAARIDRHQLIAAAEPASKRRRLLRRWPSRRPWTVWTATCSIPVMAELLR